MKKVFVDTNILEDLIADRKPFSKFAIDFFFKSRVRKCKSLYFFTFDFNSSLLVEKVLN
jgi:hypothetical protein